MNTIKDWLKDIFASLPDIAEKILEELLRAEDEDEWMDLGLE